MEDMKLDTSAQSTAEKIAISVVIPTRNEEENIRGCIMSLSGFDEIFVVDSQSQDETAEIAEHLGASVVQFQYDGSWPKKKNWAIANLPLRNKWILIVDADERVTPKLKDEIARAIETNEISGYYVRWRFIFLGRWMKHSWSHGWMLRLFRKGRGEYEDLGMRGEGGWDNEVHENLIVQGRIGRLENYLLHHSNKTLASWIEKQNEFSTWNAAVRAKQRAENLGPLLQNIASKDPLQRRKLLKAIFIRLPAKPIILFIYLYFIRLGFLDGFAGLYFCALRASHELNVGAKMYETRISDPSSH